MVEAKLALVLEVWIIRPSTRRASFWLRKM